ncbi:MAG: S1 RNA-binding domain-containing protein, partial [Gaiellaceae bacterium]
KVLDIDRDRQRISLGLKQTQSDPWQQVLDSYREDDVVEGRVAKVVTFGAFVEILPGVEGLVHISELAAHHVENPREVVAQGQAVNVRVLEIDGDRRRLSLSLKRVEEGDAPVPRADGAESVHLTPNLILSEEAFPTGGTVAPSDEAEVSDGELEAEGSIPETVAAGDVVTDEETEAAESEIEAEAEPVDEPEVADADEPTESEIVAEAEPEVADADEPADEAEPEIEDAAQAIDEPEPPDMDEPAEDAEPEIASELDESA